MQKLCRNSLKNLLEKHNKYDILDVTDNFDLRSLQLTKSEETTIRYVAGYIPFFLKNHFKDGKSSKTVLTIIKSWQKDTDGPTGRNETLSYTNEWVDQLNRGGLFLVTDNFYRLVVRIEVTLRIVLNVKLLCKYNHENIRDVIYDKLDKDPFINYAWLSLIRNVENTVLCDKLKKMVLHKWITIRATSFVKAWVDNKKLKEANKKKRGQTVSWSAEPGLRKTLYTT